MTEQATNRIAMPLQTRLMPLTAVDNEARTAEVNWTTGAAVRRYDYLNGRYYNEVLSLDPAHVRMDRLASGNTPLLNSHSGVGIESVLGVVETASLNPPTAQVRFSARADVAPIFADVKDRILRNISVGYKVYRFEVTAPITQDSDWTYTAVDWEPYELSLVPIASDPGANVRSQAATAANDCEVVMLNNRNFESTLAREIRARGAELPTAFVDEVCRTARTLDEACRQLVDEVARRQGNLPIGVTMKIVDQAAPAEVFDAMSEMLAARCGGPVPTDRARQYSSLRIVDMARQALEMNGVRTTMMTSDQIIERSLHTTSDFPNLLVNTGNKLLLQG